MIISKSILRPANGRALLCLQRQICKTSAAAAAASVSTCKTVSSPGCFAKNANAIALKQQPHQPQRRLSSTSTSSDFDALVKRSFPGAITNSELVKRVVSQVSQKGFGSSNTLLATSLCADELARVLEDDFVKVYGNNFNLGGLSGFPFAGNTGFGAMAAHIPDDGYCLLVHGPHVGICKDGNIGKVERRGIALIDNCCGSAIAASNYLRGITHGGAEITTKLQQFSDFQQGAVQELILPFGKRLTEAGEDRMRELPYALYDSQEIMVQDIVRKGRGGIKKGMVLLGGVQINTGPDTEDYFHPLRFDYYNESGECVESMLEAIE